MFKDEMIDLVDEHDNVVATMMRSEAYAKKLFPSIRSVWLNVKTKDGKFWIPRRSKNKKVLPNHFDGSVIGHVAAGETYEDAVIRATLAEIHVDLSKQSYRLLGKLTPQKHNSFCMYAIYELEVDTVFDVDFNHDDFSHGSWVSADELKSLVSSGEPVKEMLPFVFNHFYGVEF